MEIKIAHCADIHIGAGADKLKNFSDIRRSEIKSTFFNMLEIIKKENVDIVLIAGDLFHDVDIYNSDVRDIKAAFSELKSKIFISPGNHDPFTVNSPYYGEWPENVFIFKNNYITNFEIKELKTRIWGSAFTDSNNSGVKFNVPINKDDGYIDILVTHGTCGLNHDEKNAYNPISLRDIADSEMNYIALGHIHKRTPILHVGNTYYSYSGCMEGRGFKETGEKGFYLGTVSNEGCNFKFVRVAKRVYLDIKVDITGMDNSISICEEIKQSIKRLYGETYRDNLYRVHVVGIIPHQIFIDIDYIKRKLMEEIFFIEICDESKIFSDKNGNTLRDIFIKNMNNYIENAEDDKQRSIAVNALKIGLLSFEKEVYYNEN